MKQIIDISDELFSIFKKHGIMAFDYLNEYDKDNLARIIANGTPYNPTGDLISRSDALKAVDNRHEELLHDTEYRRKHCQIDLLGIKKHILAIPPVDAIANTTEVRPQGEWIKVKEDRMSIDMSGEIVTRYKCSKCERVIATFPSKLADYYPFCHCGADMRKGGAE